MPRVLRNLKINEVSGVDKGAGRGVKIMLMKRADDDTSDIDFSALRYAVDALGVDIVKTIKHENGKWVIYSEDGSKKLGTYDSKDAAVERLRQIEGHKNKRDDVALNALSAAISSIIADDACTDKVAKIDESIRQFNDYVASEENDMTPEEIKKLVADAVTPLQVEIAKRDDELALLKMSDKAKRYHDALSDEETKKAFRAKSPQAQDDDADEDDAKKRSTSKRDVEIDKGIDAIRKENTDLRKMVDALLLKEHQTEYRKRAVEAGLKDEDGETMRKAYEGDPEAQSALNKRFSDELKAVKAQVKTGVIFGEFGKSGADRPATAYQEIEAKAAELRKVDPKLSQAQAFSKAYTDPANSELVARHKQESESRLAKIAAVTGA